MQPGEPRRGAPCRARVDILPALKGGEDVKMDTDARITGGNSGGPVFNARGEAVGIVSSSTHGFTHIVPINCALAVVGL